MRMIDIIAEKRDKKELTDAEIDFFVTGVTDKTIPDYQISAFLMAALLNGMSRRETLSLTLKMAQSGDMLDLSCFGAHTVDKHSTGGVGDKTTLIVAPLAAALGCTVAKMSGRGLGHTGGTVDKLESITGYKTAVPVAEFKALAEKNGMCVVGQSGNFAPADKRLYALRDVTGTVESIPLIASSIMSKKLAAGAHTIVLDVKYGSGAFMKTPEDAIKLAKEMVEIGKGAGRNTSALITDMDVPLGFAVGNTLEVAEAVEVLKGKGPADLTEISVRLASEMYGLCFDKTEAESEAAVKCVLADGSALKKLCCAVAAQGGDAKLLTGEKEFTAPEYCLDVKSQKDGYITATDSEAIGKAACVSGAGREKLGDEIDFSAGIILYKKYGDYVKKGEPLAQIRGKKEKVNAAAEIFMSALSFGEIAPKKQKLIFDLIR